MVATNESSVIPKLPLDPIVMEDGQRDGCLANPSRAYESDGGKVFRETDDSSNQLVTSETDPWRRGR